MTLQITKRNWPTWCVGIGAFLAVVFAAFVIGEQRPWKESERSLVTGKWRDIDVSGRYQRVTYEYVVNGVSHAGEHRCEGCLRGRWDDMKRGAPIRIEYRLKDAASSRPLGLVTEAAMSYRRAGLAVGLCLMAVGILAWMFLPVPGYEE